MNISGWYRYDYEASNVCHYMVLQCWVLELEQVNIVNFLRVKLVYMVHDNENKSCCSLHHISDWKSKKIILYFWWFCLLPCVQNYEEKMVLHLKSLPVPVTAVLPCGRCLGHYGSKTLTCTLFWTFLYFYFSTL